ncbi:MAG: histidinol-phosphate transaminase [Leptolyngbyaceae cyanobacterium bins.59]|nr:histidinol-phosphate transaminase [Leptolyngbyaceae cyanobacterium bins.59]
MLPFLRSDLAQFQSYTPHPGGENGAGHSVTIDRLDTNESPYDLPEELKQKLAWTYQQTIETNRYPDGSHTELKALIAEYVNETSGTEARVEAANISLGNGSDELIRSLLIATCLRGEGSVLAADPTFSMYGILAETLGIPVHRVGRSAATFEIDLGAAQGILSQTQAPPVRAVFVVHPNSPTGNALTPAELEWLRTIPETVLVVIDEAYFEFSQTSVVAEAMQRPNWVILRTFSKAFRLAAHRVGYAIGHPTLISTLEKVRLPYNLPSFSQAATQIALIHRSQLLSAIPLILEERTRLIEVFSQEPALQVWPSSANFVFLRLHDRGAEGETLLNQIHQSLKSQGTLIRLVNQGLRITVGTPEENSRTLDRIQKILGKD